VEGDATIPLSVPQLKAIEINPYAFELAQVSVQIGYLQWRRDNGFDNDRTPVLQVRCQVWCAISAYLLVAILKKNIGLDKTLNEILQICSVNIFEQAPAREILAANTDVNSSSRDSVAIQNTFTFNSL
jgi:hypothetical protein